MNSFNINEAEWIKYDRQYIMGGSVPKEKGVYALSCPKGKVIYVGKAAGRNGLKGRLKTYGSARCHNKWIKLFFSGRNASWLPSGPPNDLYFSYWRTENPAFWESVAIQMHRAASIGTNQRNEWTPLVFPDDRWHQEVTRSVIQSIGAEELAKLRACHPLALS
ncbi:MAG: hypothetical protein DWQ47_02845 [Acidobacteria bacterium]|nr:MAG: hypothetical protein DWQ32_06395 [Acidobacteriota bacterium]REK01345.1 MAG: hypothetical protein DWQ38_02830 [Acidobacteriota bacterium]REK14301.1 MAG: hypothetical protein DWQ43_12085 [Acidobacteriota bacterium]REK45016.1 MAG: hypothetical protein DWQ47_02845 [Acidobacteriota bacterium]